jgi:hypothetical protein
MQGKVHANSHAGYTQVSAAAERIVRNGSDVRSRIAGLAVNTFRVRRSEIEELASLVEEILLGVVAGLQGAGREHRDLLLRQVFEGLADAYGQIGRENRRHDQWERFEARITEAVTTIASRAGEDIMSEFKNVADQVREAGERLKPRAKAAMHAIEEKVIEPASEAATQGAKSARRTIGVLLAAAGEMLRDFGDSIREEPKTKSKAKAKAKSRTKSKTTPTPASKASSKASTSPAPSAKSKPASASRPAASTANVKKSGTSKPAAAPATASAAKKAPSTKPGPAPVAKATPAAKRPAAKPKR